jgi:N-carbamoyl-L-amino-acid hydrolase
MSLPLNEDVLPDLAEAMAHIFDDVAAMSRDVEGVTRPAFSAKETEILEYLTDLAQQAGLVVETDAGQNRIFCLPQDQNAERWVLVGSHVDSVPRGGNFDGLAGVAAGLYCLLRAHQESRSFSRPVKVIAMRAEESAWFGPCYIASKALTGTLKPEELDAAHKGDGRSMAEHMHDIGIDDGRVRSQNPLCDLSQIAAYIELHIEQGPLLIEKGLPAAIVSGIRGNLRHKKVLCLGEAGHSGAVPRAYRHDAVLAMTDLLSRLDESWQTILQKGEDLVLTAGMVSTDPSSHALSRIPDKVSFSLDIRSQSAAVLDQMRELVRNEMRMVGRERGVEFELGVEDSTAPALMDETIVEGLSASMAHVGLEPFVMPSGGGHDAAVFANAGIPSGMVFVRNANGSHNPREHMDLDDFIIAASVIYDYLMEAPS